MRVLLDECADGDDDDGQQVINERAHCVCGWRLARCSRRETAAAVAAAAAVVATTTTIKRRAMRSQWSALTNAQPLSLSYWLTDSVN